VSREPKSPFGEKQFPNGGSRPWSFEPHDDWAGIFPDFRLTVHGSRLTVSYGMLFKSFQDSDAWRAAHEFALDVYRASNEFPRAEVFGLTAQLRRSAASVAANLAEGFGRHSQRELRRYVLIANGSLQETRYFLLLARDLLYLDVSQYTKLTGMADRVGALLGGLERRLNETLAS
jgi:four helix bundle protein